MIWQQIQQVPWAALAFQAESAIIALMVWQLTKHHYHMAWMRYAPDKARDTINQLLREKARADKREKELLEELAEVRGQLAAVHKGLQKPEHVALVYPETPMGRVAARRTG
jgi:hypothetical protein